MTVVVILSGLIYQTNYDYLIIHQTNFRRSIFFYIILTTFYKHKTEHTQKIERIYNNNGN